MGKCETPIKKSANRRTFLKTGIAAASGATMGAGRLDGDDGPQGRIRVVLADDNQDIISVVRSTLGERFHIVAAVDDGDQAVSAVLELDPDVLITDFSMPTLHGLEVANRLQNVGSRTKIVLLTLHEDPELITASLAAGVSGYVTKARLSADLVSAVEEVLKGNTFISGSGA
jgi:two-component system, NarL family, nitrate/nitrite response regulator NarL